MKKDVWGNPYTHEEHSRTTYSKKDLNYLQTCEWCGQRNRFDGLFEYDDSGKLFCSKNCYKTYYGI